MKMLLFCCLLIATAFQSEVTAHVVERNIGKECHDDTGECPIRQICRDNKKCECVGQLCYIGCPFGPKIDENGCAYACTCADKKRNTGKACQENDDCPRHQMCKGNKTCECDYMTCLIKCPFGHKIDENGCPYPCTCADEKRDIGKTCKDHECPRHQTCGKNNKCECIGQICTKNCPNGPLIDENGCAYPCTCADEKINIGQVCRHHHDCSRRQFCTENNKCVCTGQLCKKLCPNGPRRDKNGCAYPCDCANENTSDKVGQSCAVDHQCPENQDCVNRKCICTLIRCPMFCANGFMKDENGCEFCQCREINLLFGILQLKSSSNVGKI